VVVPRLAPVLSAWGMLATALRHELVRTHVGDSAALTPDALREIFAGMETEGRARLADFEGRIEIQRRADMRYGEQIFEIDVPLDDVDFGRADLIAQVTERFHRRHEELFTYALRDQEAVLVNARLAAIGHLSVPPSERQISARPAAQPKRRQAIHGQAEAAVYDLDAMAPGQQIAGPALIETETTTVLIGTGDSAAITPNGWIDIAVG
jgi:N-methylhydantoinase A